MYTNVTRHIILYFNKVLLLALPLLNEHICSTHFSENSLRAIRKSNYVTLTHVVLHQACLKSRINYNLLSDTVLKSSSHTSEQTLCTSIFRQERCLCQKDLKIICCLVALKSLYNAVEVDLAQCFLHPCQESPCHACFIFLRHILQLGDFL